jgi:hypothetical protein
MQSGVGVGGGGGGMSNPGTPEDDSRRGSKDSDESNATGDPADASSGLVRALRGAPPEVRDYVLRNLERAEERAREAEEERAQEAKRAREAEQRAREAEKRAERLAAQQRCCVVA